MQKNTNELKQAETNYQEALTIRRNLAKDNPQSYLPYVAITLINMSIFYQEAQINKEKSLKLVDEAIKYLLPLREIAYSQNHLGVALNVLKDWDIDVEVYLGGCKQKS